MKKFVILFVLSILNCPFSIGQIGTWKAYMAYSDIQEIQKAGDELFVMASNDLYQYNLNDQSIYTYDKTNGLSDTYIRHIKWCPAAKRLIVVYQNSNIDLVETDGNVININDLYNKIITGDKSVSSIRIDGPYAYLICGFGIVKVNVERAEIADTFTPNHPEYPTDLPAEDNSDYDQYIETVKKLQPGGPKYNNFYFMRVYKSKLFTCGGLYQPLIDLDLPGTVQVLDNSENWTIFEDELESITQHAYRDIDCVDIDPTDENHVFASGKTGLYEFKDGKFVREYNYHNSELKSTFDTDKNYVIVNALKFDNNGNLWMIQSLNSHNKLLVLNKDGSWVNKDYNLFNSYGSFLKESNVLGNARNIIFDSNNYLWFANDHYDTPAVYRYDINNNKSKEYIKIINQDGNVVNIGEGIRCILEDKYHNMWLATSVGPIMLEASQIDSDEPVFTQVKVPRNDGTDYADYLLSGINITCMAIDGGNRKWFGTNGNGVYLISSDNMKEIHHFTCENSKLLSNIVMSVAIHPTTGEVFFGTDKGLCSYISDAVEPAESMDDDHVYAYPNPVDFKNYSGLITVTGLTLNADVKITNAAGFLIAEGRSNGGLFTWDGKDKKGNRVGSGVYHVITATQDGKKGTVCKIAIVR